MAEIINDVAHLSQEIGPHPAGTEEEQQAALYLAGKLQKESGFTPVIEDFRCITNEQIPRIVCFLVALVAIIVSIVVPVAAIPCFIVTLIAAVLYGLELFKKPVISRLLHTGASQNVVAKYQPTIEGGVMRHRKVVLIANYDSGKALKFEQSPIAKLLPYFEKVTAGALAAAVILLFFRMTVFAGDTGAASSVLTALLVICAILCVLPVVRSVLHIIAPFSYSANNNASGVAVLMDVARQVGNGLVSNEELAARGAQEGTTVHGEDAARAANVVPQGASLDYEADLNPQESLAAAKAAIAALTGKPIADKVPVTDVSSRLVKGGGLEPVDEEAVSSVHFEVSDTPQPRQPKPTRFRTMVPLNDEPQRDAGENGEVPSPEDQSDAGSSVPQTPVEHLQQEAAEAEARSNESFERPVPMGANNGGVASGLASGMGAGAPGAGMAGAGMAGASAVSGNPFNTSGDKTPAWAKAAQEKARAHKKPNDKPQRVQRSRYADTLAAQLTEEAIERQSGSEVPDRAFGASAPNANGQGSVNEGTTAVDTSAVSTHEGSQSTVQKDPATMTPLEALRNEIESFEAPKISEETQAVLDSMDESNTPETPAGVMTQTQPVVHQTSYASEPSQRTNVGINVNNQGIEQAAGKVPAQSTINAHGQATQQGIKQPVDSAPEQGMTHNAQQSSTDTEQTAQQKAVIVLDQDAQQTLTNSGEQVMSTSVSSDTDAATQAESGHGHMHNGFTSRAIRKSANNVGHAFASRLKAVTTRKNHASEEPTDQLDSNTIATAADNANTQPSAPVVPMASPEDAQAQQNAKTSPNETAAISPIDVSRFMNKETTDEPSGQSYDQASQSGAYVDGYADDVELYAGQDDSTMMTDYGDAYNADTFSGYDGYDDYSTPEEEETQRVSKTAIQQAIHEADTIDSASVTSSGSTGSAATAGSPVMSPSSPASVVPTAAPAEPSAPEPTGAQRATTQKRSASPIVGMEDMLPQVPMDSAPNKQAKRQVIVLPDVVATHDGTSDNTKQRAPMAETNNDTHAGSKALLSNMLPEISATDAPTDHVDPVAAAKHDSFGLDLPDLGTESAPRNSAVSATGSFSTVGATGSFAPVGDELVADIDPEDRYIEDADDSAYDMEYTENGAYAGEGYVDMPKSRVGRLFGKFRSKKKKHEAEEPSLSSWVNVDENYTARSVGKARGDWSSFREDSKFEQGMDQTTQLDPRSAAEHGNSGISTNGVNNDGFVDVDYHETDFNNRRDWNGGAFSLSRLRKSRKGEAGEVGEAAPSADYAQEYPAAVPVDETADMGTYDASRDASHPEHPFGVNAQQYAQDGMHPDNVIDANMQHRMDGNSETAEQINRELRKLQDFRHPDINTEVWFVALGAEQYSHSGINAFLDAHAEELKGAIIVNLEALGAGTLSCIEREGSFKSYKPSSRIKRFTRQASERTGIGFRVATLNHRETPATEAMARGIQAFTIAGMADGDTALYSAENDILENVDEGALQDASKFVMGILKSI